MKFFVVFVVASALGLMGIQNVAGQDQECDDEAYATLVDSFLATQSFLECLFGLPESYTFGNAEEYAALSAVKSFNQSGFDAMDQKNCSAVNESILGIATASLYFGFALANDSTSSTSGAYAKFLNCVYPNETCDTVYLTTALALSQYGIGCYLALASGSYQLSDDLKKTIDVIDALNKTATSASIADQCDTLNATLVQLSYTFNQAAELIYNGSDTNVSAAFTTCLFPEPTCSVNGTLITSQTQLSCIISVNSSNALSDSLVWIVNELEKQNWTAFNASDDNDCDTLDNATAAIMVLIQNFTDAAANDTAIACAFNSCLYGNVTCNETCSIEGANIILGDGELIFYCFCDLEDNLTVDGQVLLGEADAAYDAACDAVDGGDNCTDAKDKVQAFVDALDAVAESILADPNSSPDLVAAVNECVNGSSTCNTTALDILQPNLTCICALNVTFNLTDDKVSILNWIVELNQTAYNASQALDCSTVDNATATILELMQNFSAAVSVDPLANSTGLTCALNQCSYGNESCNETCSIGDLNVTISEIQLVYECLDNATDSFGLTDDADDLLFAAEGAFVNACIAVEEEDDCNVVSDDTRLFLNAVQAVVDYLINSSDSSAELVNAAYECANLSSTMA